MSLSSNQSMSVPLGMTNAFPHFNLVDGANQLPLGFAGIFKNTHPKGIFEGLGCCPVCC